MTSSQLRIAFTSVVLLFLLSCLLVPVFAATADMMLPGVYKEGDDIRGWLISEKLDGVRGYWDGSRLLSKNGKILHPPASFTRDLPDFALEGEIWGGRGSYSKTVSTVLKQEPNDGWLQLKFAIFDVPEASGGFLQRLEKARAWFAGHPSPYAFVIAQTAVKDENQLEKDLQRVRKLGGEGLIVRKPDALYSAGRSTEILKVKEYQDAEAVVVAYLPGQGRNLGRLGALLVQLPDGRRFKIGSGFSDEEREHPPPLGETITFKFFGYHPSGIPRFPSFLRVRGDKDL